ncbi:MerR family transcriptional regulator [Clostridium perfringens]|nr:MerR family transcriptional regulator [Clostridium perfringens]
MDKENKTYFTTGEIAKLYDISKKTLFHYDKIGLFKPEKVFSNGYRYYSHYQLELLNVICILKDIGVPLSDIKEFIDNRNITNSIEFLELESEKILKEISRLKRINNIIKNKINIINEGKKHTDEIFIEEQPEEYLILSDEIDISTEPLDYNLENYSSIIKYCNENNLDAGYPVGSIMNKENIEKNIFSEYSYYFIKVDKLPPNDKKALVKPKGLYVVGYSHGYYDETINIYPRLIEYINKNNLTIIGNAYEQTLIDEVSTKDINNYVIKVSIEVK